VVLILGRRFLKEAKMLRFHNMLPALAFVEVTGTAFFAYAGPCTTQIAQVEELGALQ